MDERDADDRLARWLAMSEAERMIVVGTAMLPWAEQAMQALCELGAALDRRPRRRNWLAWCRHRKSSARAATRSCRIGTSSRKTSG